MIHLLDTNVAIALWEERTELIDRLAPLTDVRLSVITQVELEGGVERSPAMAHIRRRRLDFILAQFPVLDFDSRCAGVYGRIVGVAGYSRRKVLDRMIAAQALVHQASLATMNPGDFQDVPGLALLDWR